MIENATLKALVKELNAQVEVIYGKPDTTYAARKKER